MVARDDAGNIRAFPGLSLVKPAFAITAAEFSYYGARNQDDEPEWSDRWEGELLPRLVRLRVTFADGDGRAWPELTVATGNVSATAGRSRGRVRR